MRIRSNSEVTESRRLTLNIKVCFLKTEQDSVLVRKLLLFDFGVLHRSSGHRPMLQNFILKSRPESLF